MLRRCSRRRKICLAVFFGYGALSLIFPDSFPFCDMAMFASRSLIQRTVSFNADGGPKPIFDYTDFEVTLPDGPKEDSGYGVAGGDGNLDLNEMYSYIRGHMAASPTAGPKSPVEILDNTTTWDERGKKAVIVSRTLCRGAARRSR